MTKAKTTWMLFALAVLLTAWFALFEQEKLGQELEPGRLFFRLLKEDITRIQIEGPDDGTIVMEKKPSGIWYLLSPVRYRVGLGAIDTLCGALVYLRAKVPVTTEAQGAFPEDGARFRLTFTANDETRTVLVGNRHLSDDLVYYQVGDRCFLGEENLKVFCERSLDDWRDRGVCPVLPALAEYVEIHAAGKERVVCNREKNNVWYVNMPDRVRGDPGMIHDLVNKLSILKVSRFFRDDGQADLARFGLDKPRWRLQVRSLGDEKPHEILIGKQADAEEGGPAAKEGAVYIKRGDHTQVFLCEDTITPFLATTPGILRDLRLLPLDDYGWVREVACRGKGIDFSLLRRRAEDDWTLINRITGRQTRSPRERGAQLVEACKALRVGEFMPEKHIGAEQFRLTVTMDGLTDPMELIFGETTDPDVYMGRRKGVTGEKDIPFKFYSRLPVDVGATEILEDPQRATISKAKLLALHLRTDKGSWLLTRLNTWRAELKQKPTNSSRAPQIHVDQEVMNKALDMICRPTATFYELEKRPLADLGLVGAYARLRIYIDKSMGDYPYHELLVGKPFDDAKPDKGKSALSYIKLDSDPVVFVADPTPLFQLADYLAGKKP